MSHADQLAKDLISLFPEETKGYEKVIQDCVSNIMDVLPEDMTPEQYVSMVRESIKTVRDGQRAATASQSSNRQNDPKTD